MDSPKDTGAPPFGDEVRVALLGAITSQDALGMRVLSTLHLILGLTYIPGGRLVRAFAEHGIDATTLRREFRQRLAGSPGEQTDGAGTSGVALSPNLARALRDARATALAAGASEVTEEHLLKAVLTREDTGAFLLLRALGLDPRLVLAQVGKAPAAAASDPGLPRAIEESPAAGSGTSEVDPRRRSVPSAEPAGASVLPDLFLPTGALDRSRFTEGALALLDASVREAAAGRWDEVRSPHVFLAALRLPESPAARTLRAGGADPAVVAALLERATAAPGPPSGAAIRLHREFLSDKTIAALRGAARQSGDVANTRIDERSILRALLLDPGQYVSGFLRGIGIDPSALLLEPPAGSS